MTGRFMKANCEFFRMVMTHNPAKFRFPTLKNQSAKVRRHKLLPVAGTSSYLIVIRRTFFTSLTKNVKKIPWPLHVYVYHEK